VASFTPKRTFEKGFISFEIIDFDMQRLIGYTKFEVKLGVHINERRHIKMLDFSMFKAFFLFKKD
jgi:hypothetical protein